MPLAEFRQSQTYAREFKYKLADYEKDVKKSSSMLPICHADFLGLTLGLRFFYQRLTFVVY
jgi:hypothetical protein